MGQQDRDGFVDPALVAAWQRMLWLVRGSADVVEALAPVAAGMTKDEISRLLARAGAPSGKGVEPVEQVLALLGVVPRSRYEALRTEHDAMLKEYRELGRRVEEAEDNIERLRRLLRDSGRVDEAEQLLDSWGGLVRRTLRAQAGLVRSIANAGGNALGPAVPAGRPAAEMVEVAEPVKEQAPAAAPEPAEPTRTESPAAAASTAEGGTKKRSTTRSRPGPATSRANAQRRAPSSQKRTGSSSPASTSTRTPSTKRPKRTS